jgi:hypothetical protein
MPSTSNRARHHVGLLYGAGFALAHVHIGRAQLCRRAAARHKRQVACLQPRRFTRSRVTCRPRFCSPSPSSCLARQAVDAVQPAHQRNLRPAAFRCALGLRKLRAFGFVPSSQLPGSHRASPASPRQRAGTHLRPQAHDPGSGFGAASSISASRCRPGGTGCSGQAFMKVPQHRMQPGAEVALVQLGVQLVGFFQAQLAQRKKPVGAAAQVFVGAGRQPGQGQRGTTAVAGAAWAATSTAWCARVGARSGPRRRSCSCCTSGLGSTGSPAASARAPQHIQCATASACCQPARCAASSASRVGRPRPFALAPSRGRRARAQRAGWLIAAGQHSSGKGLAQHLRERQDHHLLVARMVGLEARGFQHASVTQAMNSVAAPCGARPGAWLSHSAGALLHPRPQRPNAARRWPRHPRRRQPAGHWPLACSSVAQGVQPVRQRARGAAALARQGLHGVQQLGHMFRAPAGAITTTTAHSRAPALIAQGFLQGAARRRWPARVRA